MWADSGYDGAPLAAWVKAAAAITLEVVTRASPHSFQVVRRRWAVEPTFGWLMRYRRLARDYERLTAHHEAMVYWATLLIMSKRLARYEKQPATDPALGRRPQTTGPVSTDSRMKSFINRLLACYLTLVPSSRPICL